jgi:hypothetical protein
MGGLFAVSTVLPGKVQNLTWNLATINRYGPGSAIESGLQILGCFLLLSVLIWATTTEAKALQPLMAYPPRAPATVIAHIAGLLVGTLLMLIR